MSNSLWPHRLQHVRLPYPSPTPGACSNSCPSSQWYHPTISSSVIPLSSCLQSFPESGSFPVSQFFTSSGQNIRVLASASVLPMNIQDWFPLGLTSLILQSKGLSRVFSNTTVQKHQFFGAQRGTLLFSQPHYQAFTESVPPSEGATTQHLDLCPHKGSLAFLSSPCRLRRMLRSMFSKPYLSNLVLWIMISKLDIVLRKSCKWK